MESLLEYGALIPDKVMTLLGSMQPTSGFGQPFQYSNTMASAAGYLGGHLVHPDLELCASFDATMQVGNSIAVAILAMWSWRGAS